MIKSFFLVALILSNSLAFAECDFSKGIIDTPDGSYVYSKECHIYVGEMVQDLEIKKEQIEKYTKAIKLKDLTIIKADKRADKWMETTLKLESNIQKIDSIKQRNEWIYFGLGALTVFAAGIMAAQFVHGP